jgi:hypothetical protein
VFFLFFFSINGWALDAHVHGKVSLDIAVEGKQLLIMLKSPAESFLGFEYQPKKEIDIQKHEQVKNQWMTKIGELFDWSPLVCEQDKDQRPKWSQEFSSKNHSSITAEVTLNCDQLLAGRTLRVLLKEKYVGIQEVNVQTITSKGESILKTYKDKKFEISL